MGKIGEGLQKAKNALKKAADAYEFEEAWFKTAFYIHAKENDVWGSLGEYARAFNLEVGRDWIFPGKFDQATGYPVLRIP